MGGRGQQNCRALEILRLGHFLLILCLLGGLNRLMLDVSLGNASLVLIGFCLRFLLVSFDFGFILL